MKAKSASQEVGKLRQEQIVRVAWARLKFFGNLSQLKVKNQGKSKRIKLNQTTLRTFDLD